MGHRVGRVGSDGGLEGLARLVVLRVLSVEDGQVVVRFRQIGEIFGQFLEDQNGVAVALQLGQNQPLGKAAARVFGFAGEVGVDFAQGEVRLPLLEQTLGVGDRRFGQLSQGNG